MKSSIGFRKIKYCCTTVGPTWDYGEVGCLDNVSFQAVREKVLKYKFLVA